MPSCCRGACCCLPSRRAAGHAHRIAFPSLVPLPTVPHRVTSTARCRPGRLAIDDPHTRGGRGSGFWRSWSWRRIPPPREVIAHEPPCTSHSAVDTRAGFVERCSWHHKMRERVPGIACCCLREWVDGAVSLSVPGISVGIWGVYRN